jgi:hypothetical protein
MPRRPRIQICSIDAKEQQVTQGTIHVHVVEELNPITIFTQMHPRHVINKILQQGKEFIIVQCLILFWMKKKMLKMKINDLCNDEKTLPNVAFFAWQVLSIPDLILKLKTFLALLKY